MGRLPLAISIVVVVLVAACGTQPGASDGFPDPDAWAEQNPQPSEGIPFHLAVGFNVGAGFDGETIAVELDGEPLVDGAWVPDDDGDDHECTPFYMLILESGTHTINAVTGSGDSFMETLDLNAEMHGVITYRHPEAWPELDAPTLVWSLEEGSPICL